MYEKNYIKQKEIAESARAYRRAVFAKYGLDDIDWMSSAEHRKARAVTCYIAHHYLNASFELCNVICNYKSTSPSTAHRMCSQVELAPQLKVVADRVYKSVSGVRVA